MGPPTWPPPAYTHRPLSWEDADSTLPPYTPYTAMPIFPADDWASPPGRIDAEAQTRVRKGDACVGWEVATMRRSARRDRVKHVCLLNVALVGIFALVVVGGLIARHVFDPRDGARAVEPLPVGRGGDGTEGRGRGAGALGGDGEAKYAQELPVMVDMGKWVPLLSFAPSLIDENEN